MISPTAISDIKAAISSGVPLTPEDIIRLNALGLRHDYSKDGAEMRIMPRLAWLGLLRNGILLKLGSPDQLKDMTASGLEKLIEESMKSDSRWGASYAKDLVSKAFGDYKRTLDAICEQRLKENTKGMQHAHSDAAKSDDQADCEADAVQVAGSAGGTV